MTASPAPPLQIYLLRHGETEWSLSGRHTGCTDLPLIAQGEEQALALRPSLERLAFSHVFTSPRLRARRTCELAGLGAAAAVDADLAEWDYGAFEGVTSAAIHKDRPDWNIFRDGCPGGEQPGDVAARADRLIARLAGMGGNVAVFSHGQFGVVLAARWAELPVAAAEHFLLDTASLNILGYHPRHRQLRVIALWNARPGLR